MKNPDNYKNLFKNPFLKHDSDWVKYSGIGIELVVIILLFLFLGIWLDGKFNSKFIFTLILTLVGFIGGFYNFYLTIKKINEERERKKDKENTD
ncbi:MAG: AtpZ/AtpI family protein [Ignavibacteria bacterium]|nr:AtpZ/AtpI family protein [Ignavibacteria bacterium]